MAVKQFVTGAIFEKYNVLSVIKPIAAKGTILVHIACCHSKKDGIDQETIQ